MEFLTILLSSLLGLLSPVGLVADRLAETTLRNQLDSVEQLDVRIDNTPSYRFAQGRVDRVRIAGRGVYPAQGIRIAAVEIETDPIAFNLDRSRLEQPLQAGVKLVLSQEDINQALQSEAIAKLTRDLNLGFLSNGRSERYDLVNPRVEFLANDRFRLHVILKSQTSNQQDQIIAESGIQVRSGRQIRLVEPTVRLNDTSLPPQLIGLLTSGISQYLDLRRLEASGITARVLKLEVNGETVTLTGFARIAPDFFAAKAE